MKYVTYYWCYCLNDLFCSGNKEAVVWFILSSVLLLHKVIMVRLNDCKPQLQIYTPGCRTGYEVVTTLSYHWSVGCCPYIILYSFFLPKSGNTQLHRWIRSCMVFYYLSMQLHGTQSIQYYAYGIIRATTYLFVKLHIMKLWQPRTLSYTLYSKQQFYLSTVSINDSPYCAMIALASSCDRFPVGTSPTSVTSSPAFKPILYAGLLGRI